jgi:hypothetical protein
MMDDYESKLNSPENLYGGLCYQIPSEYVLWLQMKCAQMDLHDLCFMFSVCALSIKNTKKDYVK